MADDLNHICPDVTEQPGWCAGIGLGEGSSDRDLIEVRAPDGRRGQREIAGFGGLRTLRDVRVRCVEEMEAVQDLTRRLNGGETPRPESIHFDELLSSAWEVVQQLAEKSRAARKG